MAGYSILIADDEANQRIMLAEALRVGAPEWTIAAVASGREALDLLAQQRFHLLITDYQMPEMNGLELLAKVRELHNPVRALLISAYEVPDAPAAADLYAIDGILTKPVPIAALRNAAAALLAGAAPRVSTTER